MELMGPRRCVERVGLGTDAIGERRSARVLVGDAGGKGDDGADGRTELSRGPAQFSSRGDKVAIW